MGLWGEGATGMSFFLLIYTHVAYLDYGSTLFTAECLGAVDTPYR